MPSSGRDMPSVCTPTRCGAQRWRAYCRERLDPREVNGLGVVGKVPRPGLSPITANRCQAPGDAIEAGCFVRLTGLRPCCSLDKDVARVAERTVSPDRPQVCSTRWSQAHRSWRQETRVKLRTKISEGIPDRLNAWEGTAPNASSPRRRGGSAECRRTGGIRRAA